MKNNKHVVNTTNPNEFDTISIRIASPERILEWSSGEVTKPETINYRTQRSEKNGLFDERIFGPEKDYECYCGKYKGIRYKGIECEKCGVEITRAIVRRERMGHIELATPVSHIWFLRNIPSRISLILGTTSSDVEKVIYFAGYIITEVSEDERSRLLKELETEYKSKVKTLQNKEAKDEIKDRLNQAKSDISTIQVGKVIDEVEYHNFSLKYGTLFEARIGAEAVYDIFKNLDLEKLIAQLEEDKEKAGALESAKIAKRLRLLRSMNVAGIRPEWMFLTRIPVIPPAIRPMVPLDGGRYATSDINDLYRRVINRNNRLKKLKDIFAPEVILRNEKRILQEAVDALIDNSIRHTSGVGAALNQANRRPLKSLSDNLKGKRGLFRQNLLGKRVDYSGRSVIVVGPELELSECGLPKHMALELFRPFVVSELLEKELAFNIRGANRLIDEGIPEVWAILEEVIKDKRVLLNRAPTLHRLGIQAFKPVLIEGNAVQVHPLVCPAFNADFDGDQMAVHVPLSEEAQLEAREFMASEKNVLKPGSGDPIVSSKMLDIVLGSYWMTKEKEGEQGEGMLFAAPYDAIIAYNFQELNPRAKIKVMGTGSDKYKEFDGQVFETTVGRIMFNSILPDDFPFINEAVDRKKMAEIIDAIIDMYGMEKVPEVLDQIKNFGFKYVTASGITWGLDDISSPKEKEAIIAQAQKLSDEVQEQYNQGLLSVEERRRKKIGIWQGAKDEVEDKIPETLDPHGSVADMLHSGARGSLGNITNMVGMKGIIASVSGESIEFPIISSSKEGFSPIEYFITTHGSRKGLTDTALNTAKAGYLTRKLFVAAQDTLVNLKDCGTKQGITISRESSSGIEVPLARSIKGRFLAEDVVDEAGKTLFKKGDYIESPDAKIIEESGVKEVIVRSPVTCASVHGVCQKCYGADLGKNKLVDLGEAVGTVAAQAIGEPGTQLTMRTFHAGGTASVGGDITQGLPRVEEIFEKRKPKAPAAMSRVDGVISDILTEGEEYIIVVLPDASEKKKKNEEYKASRHRTLFVQKGDEVKKGQMLTDGSADIDELFKYAGKEATVDYIIAEINKPYELQGETVSRKHIEVVVRQMFSRLKIKESGDTRLSENDIVEPYELERENEIAKSNGNLPAKSIAVVMGITEASLSRKSFLSAASFQHTTRVLISSAVRGKQDELVGLMENTILGRLIPAGTGFVGSEKERAIEELQAQYQEDNEDEV